MGNKYELTRKRDQVWEAKADIDHGVRFSCRKYGDYLGRIEVTFHGDRVLVSGFGEEALALLNSMRTAFEVGNEVGVAMFPDPLLTFLRALDDAMKKASIEFLKKSEEKENKK